MTTRVASSLDFLPRGLALPGLLPPRRRLVDPDVVRAGWGDGPLPPVALDQLPGIAPGPGAPAPPPIQQPPPDAAGQPAAPAATPTVPAVEPNPFPARTGATDPAVEDTGRGAQPIKPLDLPLRVEPPEPNASVPGRDVDLNGRRPLARFADEIDSDRYDPSKIFELYVDLPRLIEFEYMPSRIQLGDEQLVRGNFIGPREYTIRGNRLGSSVLNIWFVDDPATPEDESRKVHTYLLRVVPNPELRKILEARYKEIEDEINRVFPDSRVQLTLVGNKLVLSGQCRDVQEAAYILGVVRSNALPADQLGLGLGLGAGGGAGGGGSTAASLGAALAPGTPGVVNAGLFANDFIVNLLRIPGEQQIMLRVVVAEVNRSAVRSIGLNFAVTNGNGTIAASNATGGLLSSLGSGAGFGGGNTLNGSSFGGTFGNVIGNGSNNINASLNGGRVFLAFSALRTLGYARSLAEPNIVALNGQAATFQAGGEFPVPIISGFTAAGLQGVSFVPYGVILQFTPLITDRNRVRLALRADVSTRDVATQSQVAGSNVPGLQTRNFATVVEMRDGQTLAVAGLIQNNLGALSNRVPGVGDLPFVGNLASLSQISHAEQELVILITPELVHPLDTRDGHENLPLPGSDIYEPGDLEFYIKGRLESRRSTDYRSPVRSEWDRMLAYRRCEQNYIDGPHGQSLQWQRPPQVDPAADSGPPMQYMAPPEGQARGPAVPALPPPPTGSSAFTSRGQAAGPSGPSARPAPADRVADAPTQVGQASPAGPPSGDGARPASNHAPIVPPSLYR